jgi:hypothetical protein
MHKACVKHLRELNIDLPAAVHFTETPGKLFELKISITFWSNKRQNFSSLLSLASFKETYSGLYWIRQNILHVKIKEVINCLPPSLAFCGACSHQLDKK